jgi:hypothetical protein
MRLCVACASGIHGRYMLFGPPLHDADLLWDTCNQCRHRSFRRGSRQPSGGCAVARALSGTQATQASW